MTVDTEIKHTEPQQKIAVTARPPSTLRAGAQAIGIIPRTLEDVWRVARMVVEGKMAPDALTKKRTPQEQQSAVATIIMSGLELGLSPMVSMRAFGMIGNKPGLYGDGLINVCRRSGFASFIKTGYERNNPRKLLALGKTEEDIAAMEPNELTYGWLHAKRSDTGEEVIEIFTKQDAIDAQLWDERAMAPKWDYDAKAYKDKPNEAPWYRYKSRMMQWRPAGYGLRNLFADVLGGIPSMDELEEYAEDDMRDVTPSRQSLEAPDPPEPETATAPQSQADPASAEDTSQAEPDYFDVGAFLTRLEEEMSVATDEPTVQEVWELHIVNGPGELSMEDMALAEKVRDRALSRINRAQVIAAGQGDLGFPGDR